jgi:Methyltransferase FkbM domain
MATEPMGSQFRSVVTSSVGAALAVRVMSLSEIFDKFRLDAVDLLKMDIEGGEYSTLLFAGPEVLRRIRRICIEYHPAPDENSTIGRLTTHLENNGFRRTFHRHDGDGYGMAHYNNVHG